MNRRSLQFCLVSVSLFPVLVMATSISRNYENQGIHPLNFGMSPQLINGSLINSYKEGDRTSMVVQIFVGDGSCTGTIVGPDLVLTASHCMKDKGIKGEKLNVNGIDRISVDEIQQLNGYVHLHVPNRRFDKSDLEAIYFPSGSPSSDPDFVGEVQDLALLKFTHPFTFYRSTSTRDWLSI